MSDNKQDCPQDTSRRKLLAGAALLSLAPGVRLVELAKVAAADQPAEDLVRWGMLVDVNRCADGCNDCVDACNTEHGLGGGNSQTDAQYIRKLKVTDRSTGRVESFPMLCQHCESAPCVDVCPTGASFRREDGVVLVDKHTCIGCRYCMLACPYKARSFIHENLSDQKPWSPRGKGTVESCNLCVHRIDEGKGRIPACAQSCEREGHRAIVFGDLNDPDSSVAKAMSKQRSQELRADLGLNTGVRYRNL